MIPPNVTLQLIAALVSGPPAAHSAEAGVIEEHVFVVTGMNCPICPHIARHALERLDGVKVVSTTPDSSRVVIHVHDNRTDKAALLRTLGGAGFRARDAVSARDGDR